MIRLFYYDNSGNYTDFENFLFSGSRPLFDFAADKVSIAGTDYRISTINKCCEDESSTQPDVFTFSNADLDANYEMTREHGLNTATPGVIVYDGNGIKQGETNFRITRIDNNKLKFSFFDSIQGVWTCKIFN